MNDVTTNSPTSSPGGSQVSAGEQSTEAEIGALARPENIEAYAEQREADEAPEQPTTSERRLSRYERLKAARDRAIAEAVELRSQVGQPAPRQAEAAPVPDDMRDDGAAADPAVSDPAPDDGVGAEDGVLHEEEAQRERIAAIEEDMRSRGAHTARVENFKMMYPGFNFDEAVGLVSDVPLPPHVAKEIRSSKYSAHLAYSLAASAEGLAELYKVREMSPLDIAKWVAKAEATLEAGMRMRSQSNGAPGGRATQARRPFVPIRGSAAPPSNAHKLADADNISGYVAHRRAQMAKEEE